MWKVPVLLLVLGRASFWLPAEGAVTVPPEDGITTPSVEYGRVTPGEEDGTVTQGASKEPFEVPINTMSTDLRTEDWPTTVHDHEKTQSTTTSNVATSHSTEGTKTTVEKDGFATGTLIGIIVGVLLAIGIIGGIIIVVVRKMSGRYSP
ncbi:podoplanin isoform 1-T1 [Molossus nigricans]